MSGFRDIKRPTRLLLALVLAASAVTSPGLSAESDTLAKTGRILPATDVKILPKLDRAGTTPAEKGANAGLDIYLRMGAELPALPAEKPFKGKVDEAFGAFQRGMYKTALSLALPKAQKGDAASQTLVAELLDNGFGIRRNEDDAFFWYEQAAEAGDANAQYKYALMLLDGKRVKQDRIKADQMMQKAAEGGNKEAQFNLAQIKVAAAPGEKGLLDALPWYEKSAEQGVPDAQYALAQLYWSLDLPKEKRAKARYWLERAARAGYDTALYDLAVWLINGIGGERDFDQGFAWMKKAAVRGHVVARNKLAHLYINAIGTRPDPVEAAKWYVLSRRAGLADLELEDFFLGINDEQQKEAVARANAF